MIFYLLPSTEIKTSNTEKKYATFFSEKEFAQTSINIRLNALLNSIQLIKDNPILGVGQGNFHNAFRPYTQSILVQKKITSDLNQLHNEPIQLIIELGIVGALLSLLFVSYIMYRSFIIVQKNYAAQNYIESLLILGLLTALISFFTHSLISFPLHQAIPSFLFILVLGFLSGYEAPFNRANILSSRSKIILLIFCLSGILTVSIFYQRYVEASIHLQTAIKFKEESQNCPAALEMITKTMNLFPYDYYHQGWAVSIQTGCIKDHQQRLDAMKNILKVNPLHPTALSTAAISAYHTKDNNQVKKFIQILNFLYPNYKNAYLLLGKIAYDEKNYSMALQYYQTVLRMEPTNKRIIDSINTIRTKYIRTTH